MNILQVDNVWTLGRALLLPISSLLDPNGTPNFTLESRRSIALLPSFAFLPSDFKATVMKSSKRQRASRQRASRTSHEGKHEGVRRSGVSAGSRGSNRPFNYCSREATRPDWAHRVPCLATPDRSPYWSGPRPMKRPRLARIQSKCFLRSAWIRWTLAHRENYTGTPNEMYPTYTSTFF